MTEVEKAKKTLADLNDKLVAARAAEAELKDATKKVAFPAFTAGGELLKKLDALSSERVKATVAVENLMAAIGEAQARVEAAEAAAALEAEKERARRVQTMLPVFAARGKRLDKLIGELKKEMEALGADATVFAELGVRIAPRLVDVAADRALQTRMDVRAVPPGERHSLTDLVAGWSTTVGQFVNERLGGDLRKDAA